MTLIDVDDETLLNAHDQLGTDSLEETVAAALELTADMENAEEMVEIDADSDEMEVPA